MLDLPDRRPPLTEAQRSVKVYDVVFVHHDGREQRLASGLRDRDEAIDFTRRAAAERRVGRMVDPAHRSVPNCVLLRPRRLEGEHGSSEPA